MPPLFKLNYMKLTDKITITNEDCMELMQRTPDKYYDLAIVDPPYGIGEDGGKARTRGSSKTNGEKKQWDNERPTAKYFNELQRVSKNQIIWGGNYFADLLPASRCWLYWQKNMGGDFADGELAWTSFNRVLKQYTKRSETFDRIHPTQKPIKLYKWILDNYAKCTECGGSGEVASNTIDCDVQTCKKCKGNDFKILDTHGGSLSIAIACHDYGFTLDATELDKEYFDKSIKRLQNHIKQQRLF